MHVLETIRELVGSYFADMIKTAITGARKAIRTAKTIYIRG